ncbi:MAG: 1-acyl-sn-glycerol-3-phosphate acyltransferase [Pirellulales bacterium]|nr:1-acyl-sn-glycerol-3-phosphate acyltransferase [Pirellulales bacterium]
MRLTKHAAILSAYGFFRYLCRGTVSGTDALDKCRDRGFVLAANHGSYLDWLVLGGFFHYAYPLQVVYLTKERLFKHPLWRFVINEDDCLMVSDEGTKIIDRRDIGTIQCVAVFPEGTRSGNGSIGPGRPGAIKLAVKLARPIIPVGLCGFYDAWPRHRLLPRPAKCSIVFGEPIDYRLPAGAVLSAHTLNEETNRLMERISFLCGQPRS